MSAPVLVAPRRPRPTRRGFFVTIRRPFVMLFVAFTLVAAMGVGVAAPANAVVGLLVRPLIWVVQKQMVKSTATAITKNAARAGAPGGVTRMPPSATKDAINGALGLGGASLCFEWCDDAFDWLSSGKAFDSSLADFIKMLGGDYHAMPQNIDTPGTTAGVTYQPWKFFGDETVIEGTNVRVPVRLQETPPPGVANYYLSFYYKVTCEVTADSTANTQPARTAGQTFDSLYYGANRLFQTSYGKGYEQSFVPTANLCTVNPENPNNTNYYPNDSVKVIGVKTVEQAESYQGQQVAHNSRPLNYIDWGQAGGSMPHNMVQYQVSQECVDASGNTVKLSSVPVLGDSEGIQIPSCKEAGFEYSKKAEMTYDVGNGVKVPVWDSTPRSVPGAENCNVSTGGSPCDLQVEVNGQLCAVGIAQCEQWVDYAGINPSAVKCLYGANVVALSECNMLERAYGPKPAQNNGLNTDGNPNTGGQDYWQEASRGDDWMPKETPRPSNSSEASSSFPSAGVNPSDAPHNCMSAMWSWNPSDWVSTPVKCATQAMFIPSPNTLVNARSQVEDKLKEKGIQRLTDSMGLVIATVGLDAGNGEYGGCRGPALPFKMEWGNHSIDELWYPLDACTEPISTIADASRILIAFTVSLAGGLAFIRVLGKGFGFDFDMKVRD